MDNKTFYLRKIAHIAATIIGLLFIISSFENLGKTTTLLIGGGILVVFVIYDWLRVEFRIHAGTNLFFLKRAEQTSFHAITFAICANIITFSLFSERIALCTFVITTFGDASAGIIGKRFGIHKLKNNKSLEGFIAFTIIGFIVGIIFLNWYITLIMAILGGLIELFSDKTEDNFIIPIVISSIGFLLTIIF